MAILKRLNYNWDELCRRDKTSIITAAIMKHIFISGNTHLIGLKEINVNIGKHKKNLRIDILQINSQKNELVGYEIKSCIQDFRSDKKWKKYLDLINQLYFVFDNKTYEKYENEILAKIEKKAGIYIYNINTGWVSFKSGVKYTKLPLKNEEFYRKILFNYLYRNAMKAFNTGHEF